MTSCVFYNDEFLFLFQPLFRLGGPHNAGLGFAAVKLDLQTLYVPSGWVAGANTPGVVRGISAPTVIRHEQFCAWVLSSLWTKGTSIKGLRKHLVLFHALGQLRRLLLFEIQLPLLASNRPIHVGLRCVPCFLGEAADSLLRTLRAERFEKQCDSLPTRRHAAVEKPRVQSLLQPWSTVGQPKRNMPKRPRQSDGVEVFDPHGDLRLVVGADQVVFQVCSRALARSSPVWETMLHGPFSEGKAQQKGDTWEISLPEEPPEELGIIFSVVHGKIENLPPAIACSGLLKLTMLADKYDMMRLLKPYWLGWVTSNDGPDIHCGTAEDLIDYLWICHRLGYGQGFGEAFVCFVTRAATHGDGRLYITDDGNYDLYRDDRPQLLHILGTTSLDGGNSMKQTLTPAQNL